MKLTSEKVDMQEANDIITPEQAGSIKIDREFKSHIKPLTSDERDQLEANIRRDGCRDPIVTWDNVVVDGHHRLDICRRHNIPFCRQAIQFATRSDALRWIDMTQLGRRNLSAQHRRVLVGRLYNDTKPKQGGTGANQNTGKRATPDNSARALGKKAGMSERQVRRAAKFAKEVDADPDMTARVMRGEKIVVTKAKAKVKGKVQADHVEAGDGTIDEAVMALEAVWESASKECRDRFLANFTPSPAILELIRALRGSGGRKPQTGQVGRSAEVVASTHKTIEVPEAPQQVEPTDDPPLVGIARQIQASIGDLELDQMAFSSVRCIAGDIINQNKILNAGMFDNLLSCLRKGNTRARELADQAADHIDQMQCPEPARNEKVAADESTR